MGIGNVVHVFVLCDLYAYQTYRSVLLYLQYVGVDRVLSDAWPQKDVVCHANMTTKNTCRHMCCDVSNYKQV